DPRPGEPAAGCFARLAGRVSQWVEAEYAKERVALAWGPPGVVVNPAGSDTLTRSQEPIDGGHDLFTLDWVRGWDDGLRMGLGFVTGEATFALTRRVGKEWSCFWGAVRIYWPGLNPGEDEFRRHPIFFPDQYPPGYAADVELPRDVLRRLAAWANHRFAEAPL